MSYKKTRKIEKSFTLIELLAVIAIISILMAMLLPALKKVRELSQDIVCKNSIRSYGLMIFQYAGDNLNWPPDFNVLTGWQASDSNPRFTAWYSYMGVKNTSALQASGFLKCQVALRKNKVSPTGLQLTTYAANSGVWWIDKPLAGHLCRLDQPRSSSATALVFDAGPWCPDVPTWGTHANFYGGQACASWAVPAAPHLGSIMIIAGGYNNMCYVNGWANVLFFDGHAQSRFPDLTGQRADGIPFSGTTMNVFWDGK